MIKDSSLTTNDEVSVNNKVRESVDQMIAKLTEMDSLPTMPTSDDPVRQGRNDRDDR